MRVIAIAARPGDVEFAVGGTLARHRKRGDDVTIVTVANGNSALDEVPPENWPPAGAPNPNRPPSVWASTSSGWTTPTSPSRATRSPAW